MYLCCNNRHLTHPTNRNTMENNCANCSMRAKYDAKPTSFAGRFWRWHINFFPGWKAYFTALDPAEKQRVREAYRFKKYN